jgi:hypothetical protein
MITARQISELSEDYVTGKKFFGYYTELFVNPSRKEISDIINASKEYTNIRELRFIADARANVRKVYIWNSYLVLHSGIKIELGYPSDNCPYLFEGTASIKSGKPVVISWDYYYEEDFMKLSKMKLFIELLNYNWTWLDSYISGSSAYMNKKKAELDRYLEKQKK